VSEADNVAVKVSILDKDYKIACPESERAALEESARYVDRQMRETRKGLRIASIDRLAIITALNMAHELLHGQENATDSEQTRRRIEQLTREVEAGLSHCQEGQE